jgi:two-component system cell cycle response regulator
MSARYRVALHGFSEFERDTLTYCFRQAEAREPGYVQVETIADADFIVADANRSDVADGVLDDARFGDTLFIGDAPPQGAGMHLQRPIAPERILRALDRMAARRSRRMRNARPEIVLPLDTGPPVLPLLHLSDIVDTMPAVLQPEPVSIPFADLKALDALDGAAAASGATSDAGRAPPGKPKLPAVEPGAAKAAAKRASRRARLVQATADAADAPRDVLLLDPSPEPVALGLLLESFGFQVHRVGSIAAAMSVLELTPLAAAFLDADAQDVTGFDGLHLCHRIKHRLVPLARAVPAVMLMTAHDSAAERVRATLAGCDALLTLPVTRGDAARALESCKIALPADPRRA